MITLSKAKVKSKKVIKWVGLVFLAIIILSFLMKPLGAIRQAIFPPQSSKPQVAFGKLPSISFPESENQNLKYTLDTISSLLPDFSSQAKVYNVTPNKPSFQALVQTQNRVSAVGFSGKGNSLSESLYQWVDANTPSSVLTINIFSSDFNLTSSFLASPEINTFTNADEQDKALEVASEFLSKMSLFPSDIDNKKTKITNYSIINGSLTSSTSISNTNIVRIDFFQANLDNLPIFYEKGHMSLINLSVGKIKDRLRVVEAHYSYRNISKNDPSTYPIKTTAQAFLELKQGNAYIIPSSQTSGEIVIKDVLLSYYIGEKTEGFLMPIFVFLGNDGFIAYVSAVKDEWISN